jgi:hypothetical protein
MWNSLAHRKNYLRRTASIPALTAYDRGEVHLRRSRAYASLLPLSMKDGTAAWAKIVKKIA